MARKTRGTHQEDLDDEDDFSPSGEKAEDHGLRQMSEYEIKAATRQLSDLMKRWKSKAPERT